MPFHLGPNTPAGGPPGLTPAQGPQTGRDQNSAFQNFGAGKGTP